VQEKCRKTARLSIHFYFGVGGCRIASDVQKFRRGFEQLRQPPADFSWVDVLLLRLSRRPGRQPSNATNQRLVRLRVIERSTKSTRFLKSGNGRTDLVALPQLNIQGQKLNHPYGLRVSPSALMRDARVVGFVPSNSAAPSGPKIFPFACSNAAAMLSRSWRRMSSRVISFGESSGRVFATGSATWVEAGVAISKRNGPPCERMSARSDESALVIITRVRFPSLTPLMNQDLRKSASIVQLIPSREVTRS
jgi:hypothetical protein